MTLYMYVDKNSKIILLATYCELCCFFANEVKEALEIRRTNASVFQRKHHDNV